MTTRNLTMLLKAQELTDENMKAVLDRFQNTKLRIRKGVWNDKDASTYGTQEIFDQVFNKTSKYYKDPRAPWSHRQAQSYGLDWKELYELCPWVCPYWKVPMDYRIGYNDVINKITLTGSNSIVSKRQWYKPSVQHIVPKEQGGPTNDIRNIMIIPLRINILLRDMTPVERPKFLQPLIEQNGAYLERVKIAEDLFWKG